MGKRIIMYLMAIAVFGTIFYNEYKRNKTITSTSSVLNNVSVHEFCGTDPVMLKDTGSVQVISKIYEGLYTYHPLKRPVELIPDLAEGMPSISPDGLVYIFKIKKDVLFQDDACFPNGKGRMLTAADVVFTLKRIVDPNNTVPYVDFIDGKIKGLDAWKKRADYAQEVEGLQALDSYTLQVTLTAPWPAFLNFLAMWPAFVVAHEAVSHYGPEFLNHPVGTGPFILKGGFDPQAKRLEFVKNPTFRKKLFPNEAAPQYQHMLAYAGKQLPLVDKVVTHVILEEQPRWLKMQKAEIDIDRIDDTAFALTIVKDGVLLPTWAEKGLVLDQTPGTNVEFFAFNHTHALFGKNISLRKAMSMAFDRETYNKMFYNQAAQEAQSIVPSMLMDNADVLVNPYAYNLDRAKEYLVKAGYPNGKGLPDITLDCRAETASKNKAMFFAKCMEKIGITVQVIPNIWAELHNKIYKQATMLHTYVWYADDPDPASMLQLIRSKHLAGLQYENIEFNTLFDKAVTLVDRAERYRLYATLNKIAMEEVPMIFAVNKPIQFLYHKWVKNFAYDGFGLFFDQYIAVDMAEKAKSTMK
ncbi:ABC transporter substrate-binding protein [Candidatus Cardinium hertigii]|uniref:Solute-binding protein family 5 domain-containing protein n=1 Tax=Candidatus Cardinium hertigii TaxID=247481 RepID=A0A3N2QC38_9BACT|nr:ABC transporter substrate-binding protein [Candidatus Cardinium hertigii]ROT47345.1 hypothetical protein EDM02_02805 [Candidatus Cardinium hertigii]